MCLVSVVWLLSAPVGMYEILCLFVIMVIGCHYCDTSRNSDFKVTAICWRLLLYSVSDGIVMGVCILVMILFVSVFGWQ